MKFYFDGELIRTSKAHHYTRGRAADKAGGHKQVGCAGLPRVPGKCPGAAGPGAPTHCQIQPGKGRRPAAGRTGGKSMNEKQKLIRETAQKFEALRPDMQQFVLGYLVARQNTQGGRHDGK